MAVGVCFQDRIVVVDLCIGWCHGHSLLARDSIRNNKSGEVIAIAIEGFRKALRINVAPKIPRGDFLFLQKYAIKVCETLEPRIGSDITN